MVASSKWAGLPDRVHSTPYSTVQILTTVEQRLRRILGNSISGRKKRAEIIALTGAAADSVSKAVTHKRIDHPGSTVQHELLGLGGKRTISTVTLQSGNASSADLTRLDTHLARSNKPTYPTDKSGNGGGGKAGRAF